MSVIRRMSKRDFHKLKIDQMKLYSTSKTNHSYKEAIEALNSLQTNAQLLQKIKANKAIGQQNNIELTKKYTLRSGLSLDQLERELSVIHVSGTKGKGSTCALCEAILHHHGYKTGFFSSPHLVTVRERIRINQVPLSEAAFSSYFWAVYNKLNAEKEYENDLPSYFKFLTVMAFNVFLAEKVDVAIIEVGIGGEYDCTNILKKPVVVGISSLGLDHTSLLGKTVEEIAWQKAGIMKPGVPALTSPQPASAMQVLHQRALQRQCPLWEVPPLSGYNWQGNPVAVGLGGEVQTINASLALQLSRAWLDREHIGKGKHGLLGYADTFKIENLTANALKQCSWPGRYQILTRSFLHGTCTYYLDGAHTAESIELCAQWFHHATTNNNCSRGQCEYTLVYNVTGDRDSAELLAPLLSCRFDNVFFCPNVLGGESKSSDLTNLMVTPQHQLDRCEINRKTWLSLQKQRMVLAREVRTFTSVSETLKHVESRGGEQCVLVTGSLHLIGAVLSVLDPDLTSFSSYSS